MHSIDLLSRCGLRMRCSCRLNPFTSKNEQFQISPAASAETLHHTVCRTWLFIAYSDERWLYYQFSLYLTYTLNRLGERLINLQKLRSKFNDKLSQWGDWFENTQREMTAASVSIGLVPSLSSTHALCVRGLRWLRDEGQQPRSQALPGAGSGKNLGTRLGEQRCSWNALCITVFTHSLLQKALRQCQQGYSQSEGQARKYAFLRCGQHDLKSTVTAQNDEFKAVFIARIYAC